MFVLHVTQIRGTKEPADENKAYPPGQYYIWLEATEGEKINHVRFEIDGIKYREVHPPYEVIPPEWTIMQTHSIFFQVRSEKQWFSIDVDAPVIPPEDPDDPPVDPEPDPEDPPGKPGEPQFEDVGGGDIQVSWSPGDGADSYEVTYPAQPGGVAEPTTSITVSDLNDGDWFCVKSINTAEESDTACGLYQVPVVPGDPPENVSNRPEFEFLDPNVRVTWGAATGATSYLITRKNASAQDVGDVLTVDLPLSDGDWLCVRGVNEHGQSSEQSCNTYNAEEVDPDPPLPPEEPDPIALITRNQYNGIATEDGWAEPIGNFELGSETTKWSVDDGFGQANYTTGLCVGCAPINTWRNFAEEYDEVTVRIKWKLSPNFEHTTGSKQKKIYFLSASDVDPIILGTHANGKFFFNTQRIAEGARIQFGGSWTPGIEYEILLYVKLNTVDGSGNSNPDGIASVWINGVRVIHNTDWRFRGHDSPLAGASNYWKPERGIDSIKWNPTWPNGGSPPTESMWERIYDISVEEGNKTVDPNPPPPEPPVDPPPDDPEEPEEPGEGNEPAGFTPIGHLTFESDFTAQLGDAWVRTSTLGNMQILADASAPNGFVMRGRFPNGQEDGTSPWRFDLWGPQRATAAGTHQYDEIYISHWIKVEGPNYENQAVGTKTFYVAAGTALRHNDHVPFWLKGTGQMNAIQEQIQVISRLSTMDEFGEDTPALPIWPNVGEGILKVGVWTKVEVLMKINDIGQENGGLDIWLNGVHITHVTDWVYRSAQSPRAFYNLEYTPVWGGNTDEGKKLRDDFIRLADLYISAKE